MGSDLHIKLDEEERRFLEEQAGSSSGASLDAFVRAMIREKMLEAEKAYVYRTLIQAMDEAERGEFVSESVIDLLDEQDDP